MKDITQLDEVAYLIYITHCYESGYPIGLDLDNFIKEKEVTKYFYDTAKESLRIYKIKDVLQRNKRN